MPSPKPNGAIWWPVTDAQEMALNCEADLLMFGGAAGSLKSETLCMDAVQEFQNPALRGIIFRESFPQLSDIIDKTQRLYRPLSGKYNEQKKVWTFPAGGSVSLGYLGSDNDVFEYWGKEFSFIGFDESTRLTEKRIRTMLSRLRSKDRSVKLRARLATNPGGPAASMHQTIFLRGACPVHEPDKCARVGQLYTDRVWPSDGKAIPMSCAFIPGHLTDHNLLGADYINLLRMQEGSLAENLEKGCWCQLQGAYFGKIWNKSKMVLPLASIAQKYWYQFWISLDYGFGNSWASAGLYVKTPPMDGFPDGRRFKVGEICVPHTPAYQFAEQVAKAFIEPKIDGQRRNISLVFLDPANYKDIGDGHTIADQINEVFEPYGLACTAASNDRIGGAQLLYKDLESGEFAIADNCPMTAEAIRTRIHDEKKPGDIQKISGDNLDDVYDETRYSQYSFINQPEKPKEIRIAERMQKHLEANDLTNAHLQRVKIEKEIEKEDEPLNFGGNARQRLARLSRYR